jgi:pyruvate/2-oxoglutarate dehydrogenase complex dihydrolipoamide acyltransferase (E2) component
MEQKIVLPDIGEGVREGEVIQWLKKVGDSVQKDEPVVVVMTDKATVELPSPYLGTISNHYYKEGEIAIVGKPLYSVQTEEVVEVAKQEAIIDLPKIVKSRDLPQTKKVLATPATRKMAKQLGVDLSQVLPTGADGRILPSDFIDKPTPITQMEGDIQVPLHGIRRQMIKKMAESKRTIPHFSYFTFADGTRLLRLREKLKEKGKEEGIKVTFMPFFIKALSKTIDAYPELNSSLDAEKNTLVLHKRHNIGIAIAKREGLIVPVLHDVQQMNVADVIRSYDRMIKEIEAGKITPERMRQGTLTISNFGTLGSGGRWATPIINPPEVAILAVAKIEKQPVVKGDSIVAQETLKLSWSFDHRVIDGDLAASISEKFVKLIQNPAQLLE